MDQFDRKPLGRVGDDIYAIHAGTEFEADLKYSYLRGARTALREAEGEY
jgi:hypothetical protein